MIVPVSGSDLKGLARVVLIAALLGAVAVLGIANSDWVNPLRNAAEARAMDQATKIQAQKDTFDLENYKRIQVAKTEAEVEKARLEVEALARKLDQELALNQVIRYALLALSTVVATAVSISIVIFTVQYSRGRFLLAQARAAALSDPWRDPTWRAGRVSWARANEVAMRMATMAGGAVPGHSDNGQHSSGDEPIPVHMWPTRSA